jgi:NADPH-dependent glutamate synthase beta subunit-like oxidoreductase
MELGEPDAGGASAPVPVAGSEFTVEVDTVIAPLTEGIQFRAGRNGLARTRWGTLVVNEKTLATSIPGVFAAATQFWPRFAVRAAGMGAWRRFPLTST